MLGRGGSATNPTGRSWCPRTASGHKIGSSIPTEDIVREFVKRLVRVRPALSMALSVGLVACTAP